MSKLESQANEVTDRTADMQKQGADYFHKWDKELAKISNDDIQSHSMDRKNAVAAKFKKVRASYVEATALFAPFLSDLKDIRTALSTDLTTGGLAFVKDLVRKANEKAPALRGVTD